MLNTWITNFVADLRARRRSIKTITWYSSLLNSWSMFIAGRDCRDVQLTRAFIAQLPSTLSVSTIRAYVRAIRRFGNWLVEEEVTVDNPFRKLSMPKKPRTIPRAISANDFDKMLSVTLSSRDRALLLFLRDTGCRSGEACGVLVSNVDMERGTAFILGKGRQDRFVFLSPTTIQAIRNYIAVRSSSIENLFVSRDAKPLNVHSVRLIIKRIARRAGVDGRHNPHAIRHAFARDWINDGGDLISLRDLLGHADIQTTQVYVSLSTKNLQDLHRKHSPVK